MEEPTLAAAIQEASEAFLFLAHAAHAGYAVGYLLVALGF